VRVWADEVDVLEEEEVCEAVVVVAVARAARVAAWKRTSRVVRSIGGGGG